ncbi:hypothetical protein EVAR_13381_1 [Eumeta japonica]|uniref:Uncharacterized protein n=1 Tax=Eumeta variegata TaxID=151549 RepID=A0A4C1TS15_EUMVA|nr:hypothetical protein EVAR_13381_1 [Eumeta japonica]
MSDITHNVPSGSQVVRASYVLPVYSDRICSTRISRGEYKNISIITRFRKSTIAAVQGMRALIYVADTFIIYTVGGRSSKINSYTSNACDSCPKIFQLVHDRYLLCMGT